MKRSLKSFIGYLMGATDGEIGKVTDFYFEDNSWTIRYLIIETGDWLSSKKILIAPQALLSVNWQNGTFPTNLTKEIIKNSPNIDTDIPVSRQQEIELYKHYPWIGYWVGDMGIGSIGTTGMIMPMRESIKDEIDEKNNADKEILLEDHHLRSAEELLGYQIEAKDGSIGKVEDFIIDDNSWEITFLVIDTHLWFSGKKVMIAPKWIQKINWEVSTMVVGLTEGQIKNSPEYHPHQLINEVTEINLYDYNGDRSYDDNIKVF